MLDLNFMPERTRLIYEALKDIQLMHGFVLIGGTAMSIQVRHRLSEDLDFWFPGSEMSKQRVAAVLLELEAKDFEHEMVTPAWKISQSKINGIDLLSKSQDHVIGGVKVTFFARDDAPYANFAKMPRIEDASTFTVAHEETIFKMKSWLISQRVRSRDLFDLMTFVQRGWSVGNILDAGTQADPLFQVEYAKDVLTGNVPVDAEDEGFDSIGVKLSIDDIHQFFLDEVNRYEVEIAASIINSMK